MARTTKLPKIDLSKYNTQERLPSNVYSIIKNALVVFKGNPKKVADHYNLDVEKVNIVYEESYLVINQIIESKTKSNELDKGIEDSIELMSDHIKQIKHNKNSQNQILTDKYINQLTRMTDRFINLKEQNNRTFDVLINRMNDQTIKQRQLEVLESGKPDNSADYSENQQAVLNILNQPEESITAVYQNGNSKPVKATNTQTGEVLLFDSLNKMATHFDSDPDYLRKKIYNGNLYKTVWKMEFQK